MMENHSVFMEYVIYAAEWTQRKNVKIMTLIS